MPDDARPLFDGPLGRWHRSPRTRGNMLFRFRLLGPSLLFLACGPADSAAPRATPPEAAEPVVTVARIAHRDARSGAPTFLWLNREGSAFKSTRAAAEAATRGVAKAFNMTEAAALALHEVELDERGPVAIARFAQRAHGLEIFRSNLAVAISKRGLEPVAASGLLATSLTGSERAFQRTTLSAARAAYMTGARMTGLPASATTPLLALGALDDYERFAADGLKVPARAKRVFFPITSEGQTTLEPAHYVELQWKSGAARSVVVSAQDGRVLFDNDLVKYDYTYRVYADPATLLPLDGPQGNGYNPHPTGKPDRTKLAWTTSQLVTLPNFPFSKNDPWLPAAATRTEGNNVFAYGDVVDPDGLDAADVLAPATGTKFDFLYDVNASPEKTLASQRASVTQLFYVTNFMHDWFYDAGFDEKSGNHQTDNLGRGGKGKDALLAEAQDASGRNNANATVPRDGQSPRIQMFVFSGSSDASLIMNSPTTIAGTKVAGIASGFGKDLFDLTGDVVLGVDDGGADANDGCEPLGPAAGKIVLLHRGTCSFAQKAQNAQAAGAVGAIIANTSASAQPNNAPFMGGTQQGITIPVLSLSQPDGQALEGALAENPSVTMKRVGGVDVDGALDTSIVTHEWGHVLSGRLVGDGNGLNTNQAGGLGEGWADFTALLVASRADTSGNYGGVYTNGSYAMSGSGDDIYFGTRRVPYSVDVTKNPLTFKHIQNGVALPSDKAAISFGEDGGSNSEVHNTGEVWATMLWECYVALLKDGRYSFAKAQERMKRYLVASLKLTPPDPTLLEARDAVLAAALASDAEDATLFWKAFARRGAGAGAEGPPKDSASNAGVKESFYAGNAAVVTKATLVDDAISCDHDGILDEGEVATIELTVKNAGAGVLESTKARVTSKTPGVSLVDGTEVPLAKVKPFETTTLKLKTAMRSARPLDLVELEVSFDDASFDGGQPVRVTLPTRYQADEAPESATKDEVETKNTAWKPSGGSSQLKWTRAAEGSNHFWTIPNGLQTEDTRLASPAFKVEGTTFSVSYRHRWFFRSSVRRKVDQDGGVVELSLDGTTWKDISTYGAVDYNTTLDANSRGDNPLKGLKAYGNKSPGYPDKWVDSKIDVTLPAPADKVQVRFRVGNGDGFTTSAEGWDVDDIEILGATTKPFWSFVPQEDNCDPNGPTVNAGPNQNVRPREVVRFAGSGTHPTDKALTYLWRQVAGPAVKLREEEGPTPSFEAPEAPATLGFELRAHDGALLSAASRVEVNVTPVDAGSSGDDSGCSCRSAAVAKSNESLGVPIVGLAVAATLAVRRRRRSPHA